MATRNAPSRPHCVDLAPSPYLSQKGKKGGPVERRRKASAAGGSGAFTPTGAVRRSVAPVKTQPRHIGKLAAVVFAIAGAVVWTTGSSESLTSAAAIDDQTLAVSSPVIAPAEPSFFFDDNADALERSIDQEVAQLPVEAASDGASTFDSSQPDLSESNHPDVSANQLALATISLPANAVLPGTQDVVAQVDIKFESLAAVDDGTKATVEDTKQATSESLTEIAPSSALKTDPPAILKLKEPPAVAVSTELVASDTGTDAPEKDVQYISVVKGDTLSGILNLHGLQMDEMRELLTNDLVEQHLSNIDIGQVLELTKNDAGEFSNLSARVGNDRRVNIHRSSTGFNVTSVELPVEKRRVVSSGIIDQSLFLAAQDSSLKQSTIMELANIFQWELDFAREIRKGDKFSLVYDKLYREGKYIGDGDILAAEFIRGGKTYEAIRFTTDEGEAGYFTPEGKSMRRAFLRHPVDLVRITSKFNPNRLHPVLHKIRAHRGVDYGSPHGAPIYATADGKVIFAGTKSAYGNTVILQHGQKFTTLYAHMSKISEKSKVGTRVKQGDVIGYVGNTGRVTGTHLHYEFRVNGEQIDPLKVELPEAQPIANKYLPELRHLAAQMTGLMDDALQTADEKQVAAAPLHADY